MITRVDASLLRIEHPCPHCEEPLVRLLRGGQWMRTVQRGGSHVEILIEVDVECHSCGHTTRFLYLGPEILRRD